MEKLSGIYPARGLFHVPSLSGDGCDLYLARTSKSRDYRWVQVSVALAEGVGEMSLVFRPSYHAI
jgi:hypothetical protein